METQYQTKVKPFLRKLSELFRSGATESAAAEFLGITVAALNRYRKKHPELAEIFELKNERCNDLVESALLKRATGYEDANGKEVPPDIRAAVFWLQNRRPKRWNVNRTKKCTKKSQKRVDIQLSAEETEI